MSSGLALPETAAMEAETHLKKACIFIGSAVLTWTKLVTDSSG